MAKTIKVNITFSFEADVDDLNEEFVDLEGLAKDLTYRELVDVIKSGAISPEDFTYEITKCY